MAVPLNNSANIEYKYGTITDVAKSNLVTTMLAENVSLSAVKTSLNESFRPSENLTYTIRVENGGVDPIYNISVQDNLGGNTDRLLTYVANSARMIKNDVITEITPTNTAPLTFVIPDTLNAEEVVMINYVARVIGNIGSNIEEITNSATVVGHEESSVGPTVTVDPVPTLTIPKADYADVRVEKTVDKTEIAVGETLTYTFNLRNSGNIEATNIVIRDVLPEKFTVQSISSVTNGVTTTFEATDYSIGENNTLILPTSMTKTISVPASSENGDGITTITIGGTIAE